ncbi:MAG: cyclic nucleotide-binding domain-containing protein, partial [Chloroflexi bacterium]
MTILVNDQTRLLLKNVPYFRNVDEPVLRRLAEVVVPRHYQAGEIIFLEDEPDAGLHIVVEGLCKVYRLSAGGREQVLAVLKPGDSCNEVPVVDGGPNPANLVALEDSTVWVISAEALTRLRHEFPQLNEAIIRNLAMRCR